MSLHSRSEAGFEPVLQVLLALPVRVCLQITDRLCIPNPHPAEHCKRGKKEQNVLYDAINNISGADYLTFIEMKVQVKQILTHTPPCTSCPIIARSFKTGFSCAGLSSLFALSLNWTADIPQTVANTAQSVALRAYKKQMHFMYLLTSQCVMAILEGQRFHAETKYTN